MSATCIGFYLSFAGSDLAFAYLVPMRPDWWPWVVDLMMGRFGDTNPIIVAHFYCMGLWPVLFLMQLRPYWLAKPVPALPFALGSFALGAFAILPWMVLRADPQVQSKSSSGSRIERILALVIGLVGVVFLSVGFAFGDLSSWVQAVTEDNFVWTMSADFVVLWGLVAFAREQEAEASTRRWTRTLIPLIGTAWWCLTRPTVD